MDDLRSVVDGEYSHPAAANAAVPEQVGGHCEVQRGALDRSEADLKPTTPPWPIGRHSSRAAETTVQGREQTAYRRDAVPTRREAAVVTEEAAAAKSVFGKDVWPVEQEMERTPSGWILADETILRPPANPVRAQYLSPRKS
ncbi:hypothetical protein GCM10009764_70510 [Nocardia ninae]|uniref:Uncharacterized protein n=1 Tax=Nocardia ninae NBRC 108245 TaxID=1210091 RepID=A0A511MIB4_9NOCA|nr:hypothetical protein NN4_49220 [Nocardia ninae NBRC 108245]